MIVRPTRRDDIGDLKRVLDATGLFPSEMLPEMLEPFLSDDGATDIWLTCESDGSAIGFCFAAPEALADGTWNMLALAVLPSEQGRGSGGAIVDRLESDLRERGQRVLIADTSGADAFAPTRAFYRGRGYAEEARVRDFWAAGDDKIVYWKSLG